MVNNIYMENHGCVDLEPEFAGNLIDAVEDFLEAKGIDIENDEKPGEESDVIIYGSDYDDLRERLAGVIKAYIPAGKRSTPDGNVESHSEKDIYEGCVELLQDMYSKFLTYLDFVDADWRENVPEEWPVFSMTNFEIVQTLFLSRTTHSGGTSTRSKMAELGIKENDVRFKPDTEE